MILREDCMHARVHDRAYFRSRLSEEMLRAARHARPFTVLWFEALPSSGGHPLAAKVDGAIALLAARVRSSDVLARIYDDTLAVLLIEAAGESARDALQRLRGALATHAGWRASVYAYPGDARAMERIVDALAA
jgi:GGDEF domain-containing protein